MVTQTMEEVSRAHLAVNRTRVSELLLNIAISVYEQAIKEDGTEALDRWLILRKSAESFQRKADSLLGAEETGKLYDAIHYAHNLAHDCKPGPVPDVHECHDCEMADIILELSATWAAVEADRETFEVEAGAHRAA